MAFFVTFFATFFVEAFLALAAFLLVTFFLAAFSLEVFFAVVFFLLDGVMMLPCQLMAATLAGTQNSRGLPHSSLEDNSRWYWDSQLLNWHKNLTQ